MSCRTIQKKLGAFLDGELMTAERVSIEEHLRSCAACRKVVGQTARLSEFLLAVPAVHVPTDFADHVIYAAAFHRSQPRVVTGRGATLGAWWRQASVPLRAAACIVTVVALTVGTLMSLRITQTAAAVDVVSAYGLDNFSGAPDGSLEQAYFDLLDASTNVRP